MMEIKNDPKRGKGQVQVMSTLPLKAMSRIWGKFNELEIPYYLRVPGFKLYSFIFGVNLSEVSEPDLHVYPNLASFFYRTLKPGARPLHPDPNALLSPADGRVLQFGAIESGEVEQVKGMTYSLDALLGTNKPATTPNSADPSNIFTPLKILHPNKPGKKTSDASTTPKAASEAEVRADLALGEKPWYSRVTTENKSALYYSCRRSREARESYSGFAEATYEAASPILHGHALRRGEEMGGFQLGSTVVLVFEAPKGQRPKS
ncbi:hypothetical protein DID88_009900 [Monilinia fructigena]|uniref:Phosphatidylserine decarboxylase n=1 Tax=Monilinia fructigena TaxID=38457 RepID=A0A395IKK6_9HELO|nr:hypothetical protein DID88_009900 [Monilinia fructigena]